MLEETGHAQRGASSQPQRAAHGTRDLAPDDCKAPAERAEMQGAYGGFKRLLPINTLHAWGRSQLTCGPELRAQLMRGQAGRGHEQPVEVRAKGKESDGGKTSSRQTEEQDPVTVRETQPCSQKQHPSSEGCRQLDPCPEQGGGLPVATGSEELRPHAKRHALSQLLGEIVA